MFDREFVCSVMVDDDKYLRLGQLPRFSGSKLLQSGSGQFCVFIFNSRFPEDLEILGSADKLEYGLAIFDRELKKRGFTASL